MRGKNLDKMRNTFEIINRMASISTAVIKFTGANA